MQNLLHMNGNRLTGACALLGMLAWALTACQPQMPPPPPPTVVDSADGLYTLESTLPDGFDIAVSGAVQGDTLTLEVSVDIPEGAYVISALSERNYMGKFSVTWTDSTIHPVSALIESPASISGWEPFDQVYTPMLFAPTVITQDWHLPDSTGPFDGKVFFVLEPQCVPYALNFQVEKTGMEWFTKSGLVHPAYPE